MQDSVLPRVQGCVAPAWGCGGANPHPSPLTLPILLMSTSKSIRRMRSVQDSVLPRVQGCGAPAWGRGGGGAPTLHPSCATHFFISFLF